MVSVVAAHELLRLKLCRGAVVSVARPCVCDRCGVRLNLRCELGRHVRTRRHIIHQHAQGIYCHRDRLYLGFTLSSRIHVGIVCILHAIGSRLLDLGCVHRRASCSFFEVALIINHSCHLVGQRHGRGQIHFRLTHGRWIGDS